MSAAGSARRARSVPPGMVPVSIVAGGFFIGSAVYSVLEPSRPDTLRFIRPAYALLDPRFSPAGIVAVLIGAALAFFAYRAASSHRPVHRVLPVAVLGMLTFAAAVVTINGSSSAFSEPIGRTEGLSDYYADVELVDRFGARGISARWAEAVNDAESIHTVSHPPGPLLLLVAIRGLFGSGDAPIVLVQAMLSVLVLVPAWLLARRLVGARAALVAVLLLAVAPSPVLHTFLSMDAVYATMLVGAMWLLIRGVGDGGTRARAALAGLVVGLITLFTYAAAFVAVFGVLWGLWTRGRAALQPLLAAAAGGGAALLMLWLAFDFNLFSVYAASRAELHEFVNRREFLYGLIASPAAWLVFGGLPLAGLAVHELLKHRPPYLLALLVPLTVFYVLPWSVTGIIPLETERTLQFAYPLAAAAAGAAFVRWERARDAPQDRTLALLVGVTAAQTIVMEAVFFFFW